MAKILYTDFTAVLNKINEYRTKAGVAANKTAADFDVVQNSPAKWSTITKLDSEITYENSILKTGCPTHNATYLSSHKVYNTHDNSNKTGNYGTYLTSQYSKHYSYHSSRHAPHYAHKSGQKSADHSPHCKSGVSN